MIWEWGEKYFEEISLRLHGKIPNIEPSNIAQDRLAPPPKFIFRPMHSLRPSPKI
jgi:hypothetical protein